MAMYVNELVYYIESVFNAKTRQAICSPAIIRYNHGHLGGTHNIDLPDAARNQAGRRERQCRSSNAGAAAAAAQQTQQTQQECNTTSRQGHVSQLAAATAATAAAAAVVAAVVMAVVAAAAAIESRFGMDLLGRAFRLGDNAEKSTVRPRDRKVGKQTDRHATR